MILPFSQRKGGGGGGLLFESRDVGEQAVLIPKPLQKAADEALTVPGTQAQKCTCWRDVWVIGSSG